MKTSHAVNVQKDPRGTLTEWSIKVQMEEKEVMFKSNIELKYQ